MAEWTAARHFQIEGELKEAGRYGSGHINETYLVETSAGRQYILQKINRHVFRDVEGLMGNIERVTGYLARTHGLDARRVLTIVPALDGCAWWRDARDDCWRMYVYVTDSLCLQRPQSPEDFRQSGVAFGTFQRQLADFPARELSETIPRFHDTPDRFAQLRAALDADVAGRARDAAPEAAFALEREAEAGNMVRMQREGALPTRVTHNDTKLNNVLLDAKERTPLCVIDLDTVMPGLAGNDFGDSIRFGASTASEDERDLSRVSLSLALYEAYAQGFLDACGQALTAEERRTLPLGAKLMTLECGVRFLTDYLAGDVYFQTSRPAHNLDRCRTQLALVADMERKWADMCGVVERWG